MSDNKKPKKTKNTKEEIEAALARATGQVPPTPPSNPCIQNLDQGRIDEALKNTEVPKEKEDKSWYTKENLEDEVPEGNAPGEDEPKQDEGHEETSSHIAMSTEDFGRKCFNLDITARQAHYQSNKSKDPTIDEYLRGINKKIYDESRTGGFSTNVQFRVAPNDYVNVNHIIDWYKARGFQILNYGMTSVPYGNNAGLMEYNFQISWAEA